VTCAYNEVECIDELAARLVTVFEALPAYEFEVIAIENGSTDRTLERLHAIRASDPRFKIVELSRNFGFDGGLSAGLALASGDAAVLMAADLQDPPEVIPKFIGLWEQGYENVYGIVANREGGGWFRTVNSRFFYYLIGRLSEHTMPENARDFRLLDRKVYRQVNSLREQRGFVRGLVAWVGFRSIGVTFDQPERFAGRSKSPSRQLIEFAIRAIFAHSLTPLRLLPLVGLVLVSGSGLAILGLGINSLVNGVPFPGFGTIVAVMLLLFGILFCFLSVIGIYIGLIFEQVRQRPAFIIRNTFGLDQDGG
jgi:dolichol-phosphate mannosyltransferase